MHISNNTGGKNSNKSKVRAKLVTFSNITLTPSLLCCYVFFVAICLVLGDTSTGMGRGRGQAKPLLLLLL